MSRYQKSVRMNEMKSTLNISTCFIWNSDAGGILKISTNNFMTACYIYVHSMVSWKRYRVWKWCIPYENKRDGKRTHFVRPFEQIFLFGRMSNGPTRLNHIGRCELLGNKFCLYNFHLINFGSPRCLFDRPNKVIWSDG